MHLARGPPLITLGIEGLSQWVLAPPTKAVTLFVTGQEYLHNRPRAMTRAEPGRAPNFSPPNSEGRLTNSDMTFPLLQQILAIKNLPLQPTYTIRNIAVIFGVSPRAIQNRVASGQLVPRDLPGRAKFLNQDVEDFLRASRKRAA